MTEFSDNSSFYNQHNLPENEVNSQNDIEVSKNTSINKKPLLIPSGKLSFNNSKTKVSCSLKTSKIISKAKTSSIKSLSKISRSKNSKKTLSSTAANSVTISKNNSINKRSFSNLIKQNKPTSSKSSKKVVFVKESHPSIEHEDKNGIVYSQISESSPVHIKRKLSRKDSYKHSIMVAEKKLKWKEEEKGNIQLFNDNEHQISKKRNVLGDFKDIDEENKSQGRVSRKQSKKSISCKQSYKSFSSKKPNSNHNNEEENILNSSLVLLNEMLSKSNNDECDKKLFNVDHLHKQENKDNNEIEIEHNNIGLSEKERIVKMNEKFYALYNEIKNKAKTAREKNTIERKTKLSKSQSQQYLAKSISSRNSKLSYKTNCNSKTLLYKILFQSDGEENNSTSNREQIKRRECLQKKFKLLKKTRSLNCFNKLLNKPENHFSHSSSARQLHKLKPTQNLNNDSFLNENNKNKEESKYKTFEELKTKTLSPKFTLNNLSITKRIHFTPFKLNHNNQVNPNNTTKAKCRKYKEVNNFLKHSENTKYDNCINKVKVFPPNAIDKNKFN